MAHQLSFDHAYRYPDDASGIAIPLILQYGGLSTPTTANVDCGAEVCLFSNETAQRLGIPVESGIPIVLDSIGGPLEAYGHEVVIQIFGLAFYSFVYFSKYPNLARNLFGRLGGIRQLRLGLVDYDSMIFLHPYNS
jgi:hypothetical protein